MSASDELTPPTQADVEAKLAGLIAGGASRAEVADWAAKWVRMPEPNVENAKVWKALTQLSAADMVTTDRPYLYDTPDFAAWLEELRRV